MNDLSAPFFSIVMPIYNGSKYVKDTLCSFLNQRFRDIEIICVDDSSLDDSYEIINEIAKQDARVRLFRKKNEGIASKGIEFALPLLRGKWYMYSSQDDLVSKNYLQCAYDVCKSDENIDAVVPNLRCYKGDLSDETSHIYWSDIEPDGTPISGHKAFEYSLDWRLNGFGFYKTEIVRKVGIRTYNYNSDEFTTRMLFLNCRRVGFSEGIFYYRINNPNAITKRMSMKLFEVFETNRQLEALALEQNVPKELILKLRELAINDIAIRQKILYKNRRNLSHNEIERANYLIETEYNQIRDKQNLFKGNMLRKLFLTNGLFLIKLSMKVRSWF